MCGCQENFICHWYAMPNTYEKITSKHIFHGLLLAILKRFASSQTFIRGGENVTVQVTGVSLA